MCDKTIPITRFESIDILRGFAALSVVVYHVIEHMHWKEFPSGFPLVWFRIGWLGVDLFFVISGFVIGLSGFSSIDRSGIPGFRLTFLVHRLARIAPLFYLTCLLFLVMVTPGLMFNPEYFRQILTHLVFVHNTSWITIGGIDGPNWSVGTEMQFYLMFCLLAPWLRSAPTWMVGGVLISAAWFWRAVLFHLIPIDPVLGVFPRFVYTSAQLPGTLDEFAFGILLARFIRAPFGQRFLRFSEKNPTPVLAGSGLLLWLVLRLYWINSDYWTLWSMVVLFKSLIALAAAGVVLVACCLNQRFWLRFTAPLRYLGTISYGIYLWHLLVLQSLERVPGLTAQHAMPVVLWITVLLAAGSWHLFERPILIQLRPEGPSA